jgi:hypothetical protein
MLAVTLLIGLLLKVKDGYENSGKYEDGFTAAAMTGVLVSTIVAVRVAGIGAVVYDTRRVLREPLLQYKEGRGIVTLPPIGGASFDLFLSHAQDLGQDQVATIKGMLEKLLPSIKIFLDVESLDDLHALDKLITGSKAVLIFLTTGPISIRQPWRMRLCASGIAWQNQGHTRCSGSWGGGGIYIPQRSGGLRYY